jgi:hypothetical protein
MAGKIDGTKEAASKVPASGKANHCAGFETLVRNLQVDYLGSGIRSREMISSSYQVKAVGVTCLELLLVS